MGKIKSILILGLQIVSTFIVALSIYMIFALLDNDFGMDGLFGLFVFQPIIGILASCSIIVACLLIGLPIRLNKRIYDWWINYFYIAPIGILIGIVLLILATYPNFQDTVSTSIDGQEVLKHIPNPVLATIGWILVTFSMLHSFPSKRLTDRITSFLQKAFNVA
jgi:hypothetical protein